jgi:tetratricopeptide (TPR) repeat protein
MAEWSGMCQKGIDPELVKRLEVIAAAHEQHYVAYVCRGVALGLGRRFAMALPQLEQAITLDRESWSAYFWKSMICASLRQDEEALTALNKAIALGLPPVLLTPLNWLEQERSDFYEKYVVPLVVRYNV